jgi:pyrroloquinoline quinone (PQQ) biosynthesis protein C
MGRLKAQTILMLSPHVTARTVGGTTTLDSPYAQYVFKGRGHQVISAILPLLDGGASLRGIADRTGFPLGDLQAVLEPIPPDDLVDLSPLMNAGTTGDFMSAYFPICDAWARNIFGSGFWRSMFAGTSSRLEVLGWGIEFYHRTLGADEHNETSVKNCTSDPEVHKWLTEHFQEEYGHGDMFLRGLVSSGLSEQDVVESTPLPSTRALIEYFNRLASTDSVAYLGCYGVMHSPRVGQTRERVNAQFDELVGYYPFAAGVLNAIREHASLDLDLGHDQIVLERLAARERVFSPDVATRIMRAARGVVTAFCGYFDGIQRYYAEPGAVLARPRSLQA